jgi:hypothetical protein
MNIMDLARQANLPPCHLTHPKALARFAALVRAEVLEEAAAIVEQAAMAYAEPVWAQEITADIRDRKEKT